MVVDGVNMRVLCRVEEVLPFERQLLSHQFVAAVLRDMYGIQVRPIPCPLHAPISCP